MALSLQGLEPRRIAALTYTHPSTVYRWLARDRRGEPLTDQPRSGRPRRVAAAARLRTMAVYCQQAPPLPGLHTWSLRDAQGYFAAHPEILGTPLSVATLHRILQEHALRPHRRQYYLQITDPDFFPKMEHVIELYLHPPAQLFCFDECTCMQALQRLTPDEPARPHQPRRQDFDYHRHGITDLMAFLHPATGTVYGECTPNHDRHTLCRVFTAHVATLPADAVLHYLTDNLTTHYHDDFCQTVARLCDVPYTPLPTGAERRAWLQSEHKRIVVHFVPFHASWLNLVEIWFGILKGKCLQYGHFLSVEQLCHDVLAFIATWNECFAHPFSWSYTGEGLYGSAVRRFCRLLAIETPQMDSAFLRSQLRLMTHIADQYVHRVPVADWAQLRRLAADKDGYLRHVIEAEAKPRRQQTARDAYTGFLHTVLERHDAAAVAA